MKSLLSSRLTRDVALTAVARAILARLDKHYTSRGLQLKCWQCFVHQVTTFRELWGFPIRSSMDNLRLAHLTGVMGVPISEESLWSGVPAGQVFIDQQKQAYTNLKVNERLICTVTKFYVIQSQATDSSSVSLVIGTTNDGDPRFFLILPGVYFPFDLSISVPIKT